MAFHRDGSTLRQKRQAGRSEMLALGVDVKLTEAPDVDQERDDGVVLGHEPHDSVQAQVHALDHHALAPRLGSIDRRCGQAALKQITNQLCKKRGCSRTVSDDMLHERLLQHVSVSQ